MKIIDYLQKEDVFLLETSKSKKELYEKILPKTIENSKKKILSKSEVIEKINDREKTCSFVIKKGYAIPHARLENIEKPIIKLVYIKEGLDFDKDEFCNFIILFLTPLSEPKTHLQIMAKVLNIFKKEDIIHRIKNAKSSLEIYQIISSEENSGHVGYSSLNKNAILSELMTSENGISNEEALERINKVGKNLLKKSKGTPQIIKFLKNMASLFAILLWIGGGLCFIPGVDMPQLGFAIFVVIIVNAIFSFWQEFKAERAVEELQKLIPNKTKVLRNGEKNEIDSSEIVFGDIVFFEEGDIITADARLLEASEMKVNNSMLTGESRAIYKTAEQVSSDSYFLWTELPNMVFAGTTVSSGSGTAVVIGTGMNTEVGNIAAITQSLKKDLSPLQKEMKKAVNTISVISISLGITFFFLGKIYGGLTYIGAFIFTIGITVANIPEGLLPTLSLALAMGVTRMAKKNVLVKELSSVETLGSASVICTDKTGTITTNKISVCKLYFNNEETDIYEDEIKGDTSSNEAKMLLNIGVLCNNSVLKEEDLTISGDPTEGALLALAKKCRVKIDELKKENLRIQHFPFESIRKMMTTVNKDRNGNSFVLTKGAPLETLEKCEYISRNGEIRPLSGEDREKIKEKNDEFASQGLRVLAFAYKILKDTDEISKDLAESSLIFVGMTGMIDPHRPEVPEAIKKCRAAGIKVFIITGDYGLTARAIAYNIGLIESLEKSRIITGQELSTMDDKKLQDALKGNTPVIFSRMEPIQKMRVTTCCKNMGEVVAVTGDGVNDAIALKSADIGIAMGNDASSAAKEAASMIVLDGNFASIVYAIEEGRAVYANIKRFVTYIFSSNVPELVPFILFVMLKIPLPLTVMQILAIDLGTDLVPALALGVEKAEPGIMNKPPRKKTDRLIDFKLFLRGYFFLGIIETTLCMAAYTFAYYTNGWRPGQEMESVGYVYTLATTMSLVGIVAAQVGNIYCCRTDKESVFKIGFFSNPLVLIGIISELLLINIFVYIPFFQDIFGLVPLGLREWIFLASFPFIMIFFEEIRKLVIRKDYFIKR